jgi:hypothetical protein
MRYAVMFPLLSVRATFRLPSLRTLLRAAAGTALVLGLLLPTASAQAPAGEGKGKVVVLPESFLRGYDPITIFFTGDTGPKAGGPEDHPGRVVKLEPQAPGEYRWVDARTLLFRPAVPWPALEKFQVTAGGAVKVLHTLMVRPTDTVPREGAADLAALEEVTLTFSEPLPKEKLARMTSFEIRPLPGTGAKGTRYLGSEDFAVKALERASLGDPVSYAIRLKQPIGGGNRILLKLRLSSDEKAPDSNLQFSFKTQVPFRVSAVGCAAAMGMPVSSGSMNGGEESRPYQTRSESLLPLAQGGSRFGTDQALDCGTETPRIALQFTAEPGPLNLSAVKALVRFTPTIPDLAFEKSGNFLVITGRIERETLYRAEIQPIPLRDQTGRLLQMGGSSVFHFFFPRQGSFLRWSQSEGILERFGPQMFPLTGRGDTAVDLRAYRIDPLDRNFWPFPGRPVSIDESQRPPGPGEEPATAGKLQDYIDQHSLANHLRLLGSPIVSRLVPLPLRAGGGSTSFGLPLKDALTHISGPEQPGTYLLGIRRVNEATAREYVRVQVTDLCLTTVEEEQGAAFVVTSLRTGKPVPGATIRVEGSKPRAMDGTWAVFIAGTTDASGRYRFAHKAKLEATWRRIVVQSGKDTLVLAPSDPPYAFTNNHWYGPSGTWLEWLNAAPHVDGDKSLLMAHLLTERPVYRPEEPVYLKGYLRLRENGRLKFAPKGDYEVAIIDSSEKEHTFPAEITEAGSFAITFQEKDLPTGQYRADLRRIGKEGSIASVDWKMEAYKIPRFEVKLHGPDWVPMDREFKISAVASYFAGGKVVGQEVRWRVTQFPATHVPEQREGWLFSSDERFSKGGRFEPPAAIEKADKTDGSGASVMAVNPALEMDARPRKYVFEVMVTGADDQTVTAVKEVKALPPFLIGLKVDRFIQGEKVIRPSILALDGENKALAGQEVNLRILKRQWHSYLKETDFSQGKAKYITDVVEEPVAEKKLTTGAEPTALEFPVTEGGLSVVEASSRDSLGRLQIVTVDLFVAGNEPLSWKKPQQNVFETASDKKEYVPGDIARILIKSPFQQAHGLAVVEGPDGNTYHALEVIGGKAVFELPIRNEYNPRIPVHFVLMRGRLPGARTEGRLDLGKPSTMAATQWLKVDPEGNRLDLKLEHPNRALPGERITVKMHLRDSEGKPLPGEVTLALVDLAVLSLGKEKRLDPLPSFIKDVRSRITIRDTRNKVIGELVTDENPGGDGTDKEGSDLLGKVTVRKRFKTVPYYNPRILVGPSGDAEVTIELSDDLTVFKVKAMACSGPDRFGSSQSSIAVRLPVIVQPALPRFARTGDRFSAGGIGRIVEGEGGPGRYQIHVQGAEVSGDTSRTLEWVKDKAERLYFPLSVGSSAPEKPGTPPELVVKLAVKRNGDGASDAFETRIPILPDRDPVEVQVFKAFQGNTPLAFPAMKEAPRPGSVRQAVLITDQVALLKMVSGLDYLFRYPHACTEQFVSRAFPAVALKGLYGALDLKGAQAKTDELVGETFEYLGKTQQPDGLYAFWPGGRGYVHLTAYVVEFLLEAKKLGYAFEPKLLDRSLGALKEALRSDYSRFLDGYAFSERADALYALSLAGQFDPAYGSELAKKAKYSDLFGEARILQAYNAGQKGSAPLIEELRQDLWNGTLFKLRDGSEVFGGLQARPGRWDSLALSSQTTTQAALIRALAPKDQPNPKFRMIIEDLVASGEGDGWGNTHTNAAALLALNEVVRGRKDAPAREFRVEFGETHTSLKTGDERASASLASSSEAQGKVVPVNGSAAGMVARLGLVYTPQATGDQVKARNEGFVVRREIIRVASDGAPPAKEWLEKGGNVLPFTTGDVIEEHIQIINPEDRNYVAVVAPFAAGLEPLNPNLATAPKEAQPAGTITRQPSYAMYLDSEVRFYYETLPAGTYDFYFRLRATTSGTFTHPAAHAEMMYQPLKKGNSPGARVEVKDKAE